MAEVKKNYDLDKALINIMDAESAVSLYKGSLHNEISTQAEHICESLMDAGDSVLNLSHKLKEYNASTKKSTSKPQAFSDMVKKQRAINKGEDFYPEGDNGPRMNPLFDGYYALGREEQMVLEDVCIDLGMTGFKEFVDRAIMLFYEKGRTHQD